MKNSSKLLVRKHEWRRDHLNCKWEDNIELGLKDAGCESEHWIELA
jgi:hypothetical protein